MNPQPINNGSPVGPAAVPPHDIDDSAFNIAGFQTTPATPLPTIASPQPIAPVQPPVSSSPAPIQPIQPAVTSQPVLPAAPPQQVPTVSSPITAPAPPASQAPIQSTSDYTRSAEHTKRGRQLRSFLSLLAFIASIFVAAFLINQFVFQSYFVDGTSMTPTLQNDDRLIIDKVEKSWAGLQGKPYIPLRGQIVVLDSSILGINGRNEQLIKRVIGLPGDTISISDSKVTIKNSASPDGFNPDVTLGLKVQPTYVEGLMEITVPPGEVFVMGDNRVQNGSYDSRSFGSIGADKIQGRLWARILPLDKAQTY